MDWPLDEDFEQAAPPRSVDRQLVPEGHHDFTIQKVTLDADRLELVLVHPDKSCGWVFAGFPREKAWARKIVNGLPLALGISADQWARMDPHDLVGMKVRARIYHNAGRDGGKVFVNVGSFHAVEPDDGPPPTVETAAAPPAASFTKRRTPATKVQAADHGGQTDDIPF